jgi:hypothetical protein
MLTGHPHLVLRSLKSTAIPLPPLWAREACYLTFRIRISSEFAFQQQFKSTQTQHLKKRTFIIYVPTTRTGLSILSISGRRTEIEKCTVEETSPSELAC